MALTGTDRGSGTSASNAFSPTSNCTAGALVVACLSYPNSGGGGTDPFTSFSDSHGNTWTLRQNILYDPGAASAGFCLRLYTSPQDVATLTTSSVLTMAGPAISYPKWTLMEFVAGAGNTATYVGGGAGTPAANGTPTVTTASIPSADAVVGAAAAFTTVAAGVWTGDSDTTNGSWSAQQTFSQAYGLTSQRKIVTGTATQTYNPTVTNIGTGGSGAVWISVHETVPAGAANPPRRNPMPQLLAH